MQHCVTYPCSAYCGNIRQRRGVLSRICETRTLFRFFGILRRTVPNGPRRCHTRPRHSVRRHRVHIDANSWGLLTTKRSQFHCGHLRGLRGNRPAEWYWPTDTHCHSCHSTPIACNSYAAAIPPHFENRRRAFVVLFSRIRTLPSVCFVWFATTTRRAESLVSADCSQVACGEKQKTRAIFRNTDQPRSAINWAAQLPHTATAGLLTLSGARLYSVTALNATDSSFLFPLVALYAGNLLEPSDARRAMHSCTAH
jgi:hypothetical protein